MNSLEKSILLPLAVRRDLQWWLLSFSDLGLIILYLTLAVVSTDASLSGWGEIFGSFMTRGLWSLAESFLQINLPVISIFLALSHGSSLLQGLPVRVQTDNTIPIAYLNHHVGTRSSAVPYGSFNGWSNMFQLYRLSTSREWTIGSQTF